MRRRGFAFGRQTNPNMPPALKQAFELMELGNYAQAAQIFEQLAIAAENRMGPRAPFLFIQAGRALIQLNENEKGTAHIRHGLELLANSGRFPQFYRAGNRVVQELKMRGLENEALEISKMFGGQGPASVESPTRHRPDAVAKLPSHCPACGGPLRSDEADWIDPFNAECPYCGSPIRAD